MRPKNQREMMKTTACREFTLEFLCPVPSNSALGIRMLGNTLQSAINKSRLRFTGFRLHWLRANRWQMTIGCYDRNVSSSEIAKVFDFPKERGGIKLLRPIHRGKVTWPPKGPRTKTSAEFPSLAKQLELWEQNPDEARKLQKRLDAEAHRDEQRRSRNERIYQISAE